jgi:lipid-binding SYLF domain-containing protein
MTKRGTARTRFSVIRLASAVVFLGAVLVAAGAVIPRTAIAETADKIDREVDSALLSLYASSPAAKELSKVAKGILVFPDVVKAGLIVGGQYGTGALRVQEKTVGYYNTVSASYGLQAGAQKFGYALFFITQSGLDYLTKSKGWEIGVGPSVVVVDEGIARSLSTTTAKEDIYAFFFDQKGLMAGLGLQGSKITKITPDKE